MKDFEACRCTEFMLRDFNTAFNTEPILNFESVSDFLSKHPTTSTPEAAASDFWTTMAIPALTLYASLCYRSGDVPNYVAFIHTFDILAKSILIYRSPSLENEIDKLRSLTYGGFDNIGFIIDCIKRIDTKENDPKIPAEKLNRMLAKASSIAANDIGARKKITDQVNNSFKLSRTTRVQKLEFLLILEEFVKTRFHADSKTKPRISERNDYKTCIDTIKKLTTALTGASHTDTTAVAIAVLTPHATDFSELERLMRTRFGDRNAIYSDLSKIRQNISKAENRHLSSRGTDVSVRMNVAKIISKLENNK